MNTDDTPPQVSVSTGLVSHEGSCNACKLHPARDPGASPQVLVISLGGSHTTTVRVCPTCAEHLAQGLNAAMARAAVLASANSDHDKNGTGYVGQPVMVQPGMITGSKPRLTLKRRPPGNQPMEPEPWCTCTPNTPGKPHLPGCPLAAPPAQARARRRQDQSEGPPGWPHTLHMASAQYIEVLPDDSPKPPTRCHCRPGSERVTAGCPIHDTRPPGSPCSAYDMYP